MVHRRVDVLDILGESVFRRERLSADPDGILVSAKRNSPRFPKSNVTATERDEGNNPIEVKVNVDCAGVRLFWAITTIEEY
jgi:hypothetical protein